MVSEFFSGVTIWRCCCQTGDCYGDDDVDVDVDDDDGNEDDDDGDDDDGGDDDNGYNRHYCHIFRQKGCTAQLINSPSEWGQRSGEYGRPGDVGYKSLQALSCGKAFCLPLHREFLIKT